MRRIIQQLRPGEALAIGLVFASWIGSVLLQYAAIVL